MPSPNWLNDNRNRAFPFLKRSTGVKTPTSGPITMRQLPDEWIVDAGFVVGVLSEFGYEQSGDTWVPTEHSVYLRRIFRRGDMVFFEFSTDAPLPRQYPLIFTRHLDDPLYSVEHLDGEAVDDESTSISASEGEAPCIPILWSGYLITGDLSGLADLLGDGEEILRGSDEAVVEPALVQNLFRTYANDLNLANADRTRATGPEGCDDPVWDYPTGVIFVQATCLQGDLYWKEGFNCIITQDPATNSLTIGARPGAGEGYPCAEVPLFLGESPPVGATNDLLAGGLLCNETLRSINGIGGPLLTFLAGAGVSIVADPENHKLTIDVNMIGLAVCFSDFSQISESV